MTGRKNRTTGRRYGDPLPPVDSAVWEGLPEGRVRNVAMVTAMRAAGWLYREITEATGIARATADAYIHDPNGSIAVERKNRLYACPCIDCGAPLTVNGPKELARRNGRCTACAQEYLKACVACRISLGRRQSGTGMRWTDEDIFAAVRACVGADGCATTTRYKANYVSGCTPSLPLILKRFDTWNAVCAAAGVSPGRARRTAYKRTTADDCLAAVARVADGLGRLPTYQEYELRARADGLPSASAVRNRVGSWADVLLQLRRAERKVQARAA